MLLGRVLLGFCGANRGLLLLFNLPPLFAQIGDLSLSGWLGWLAYLFVHLFYLIGFRNRLAVFGQWAWYWLRYDRPIRIIARARQVEEDADPF